MIKLNLGCGARTIPGYINFDKNPDYNNIGVIEMDVSNLSIFQNETVDEIYNSHVIEHFDFNRGIEVLREWYRVLKPGGKLIIETPDFYNSCKFFCELYENYDEKEIMKLYGHFFSEPWKPFNIHLFLYSEIQLKNALHAIGFKKIKREKAVNFIEHFPGHEDIFLRVECEK
jgi:ubiquinone/menaquinone biosynthesis C-methylase UbiE